ncbi:pentatricopeptide repeat-containing protein [Tanacetum coccineum]
MQSLRGRKTYQPVSQEAKGLHSLLQSFALQKYSPAAVGRVRYMSQRTVIAGILGYDYAVAKRMVGGVSKMRFRVVIFHLMIRNTFMRNLEPIELGREIKGHTVEARDELHGMLNENGRIGYEEFQVTMNVGTNGRKVSLVKYLFPCRSSEAYIENDTSSTVHLQRKLGRVVSCTHVLSMQGFRILAQDVLLLVVRKVGVRRRVEMMEVMWRGHFGYESDFLVLDSFMRVFVNLEMEEQALEVVRRMRGIGLQPSLSALSALFKLFLRVGDYESVWKLFIDMVRERPHPCLNVMIHGFCRNGEVRIGESLLYLMSKFECKPDVITYNILINAYCIRGQTLDALSWVDLMVERGCSPSTATFSTIINASSKEGNIVEARNVFDWMQDMGVSPSISVYNALIDGLVSGYAF